MGAIALLAKWRCTVKGFNQELERGRTQMRRFGGTMLVAALLTGSVAGATTPAGVPTEEAMRALALQWFTQMQAGEVHPAQNKTSYSAQITHAARPGMSHPPNQ